MDSIYGMRILARVVEAGGFSAAARQLDLAPSSISRQIQSLEDELGARLFHRTTRKLSLTEAGGIYYERASRILIDVDEAKLAASSADGRPSGVLRLTAPASLARLHIVPAVAVFQQKFPAVNVLLSVTDRQVDLVEEGFDVSLRLGRLSDTSLMARKIGSARRNIFASPIYLEREGPPQAPADLENHSCVVFRSHPGRNVWSFRERNRTTKVRVGGKFVADNGEALVSAAVAGLGLILVPRWLASDELEKGRLVTVLAEVPPIPAETPLYALYPHQRHLPPKVRVFIDFFVERFAGETLWNPAA